MNDKPETPPEKQSKEPSEPEQVTSGNNSDYTDEDSKQTWNELNRLQKEKLNKYIKKLININAKESNSYDSKLYNWSFILNAGGLIGTGTLLTISSKDANFVNLCIIMMFGFISGIILIIFAAKSEISRYRKDSARILNEKNLFKENHTSYSYFKNKIEEDNNPSQVTVYFENISLGIFFVAAIVGLLYLIFNNETICERKEQNQIYPCIECEESPKQITTDLNSNLKSDSLNKTMGPSHQ